MFSISIFAATAEQSQGNKKLDLSKWHDVGNIWLRVSNYGFFGSGSDASPQYPSLEYPGGSGIDYLFQGALWFGAKKVRRDPLTDEVLYWTKDPNSPTTDSDDNAAADENNPNGYGFGKVIDTLVTVGFDGDLSNYEMLPAYNPRESGVAEGYTIYNSVDQIATASI